MFPQHPDLERLGFAASTIGRPEVDERSVRVRVRHLWVGEGFPGHNEEKLYKEVTVVFDDVASSERHIHEYEPLQGLNILGEKLFGTRGKPRSFKGELYTIADGPFVKVEKPVFWFTLGPISHDPDAFVEWYIQAASVRVEDGIEY